MSEELAVVGLELEPQGIMTSKGSVTIVSTPATKLKAGGKFVYLTPLQFTSSGGSASGYISGTVRTSGTQSIPATATKVLSKSKLVMRHLDQANCTMLGVPIGQTALVPFIEPWRIEVPAQIVALGK